MARGRRPVCGIVIVVLGCVPFVQGDTFDLCILRNKTFHIPFILLLASVLSLGVLKAEEILHPELLNLFDADLIVDASFKSQDGNRFYIIVNETIKDLGYGIQKGDQINLPRVDDGCVGVVDFSYYKRRRYYLKKTTDGWRLNYGSTQSIKDLYTFGHLMVDDRFCGLSFVPPHGTERENMNKAISEFVSTYRLQKDPDEFIPLVDALQLKALANRNIMIAAFEERGRCCIGDSEEPMIELEPEVRAEVPEEELPLVYCDFLEQPADYPFSPDELRKYITIDDHPLQEAGIAGKVIVQITLSDSGSVIDVEVKKGLHPILDSIAVQRAFAMPNWIPAEDRQGRKRSCFTNLPFIFNPEN